MMERLGFASRVETESGQTRYAVLSNSGLPAAKVADLPALEPILESYQLCVAAVSHRLSLCSLCPPLCPLWTCLPAFLPLKFEIFKFEI